ncbi:PH domain-containing protein [Clostridium mediterraneense]|uniref:PH domain-containing protein n=1 Tax=Clostridium mediterraneense TaxID=1805472 RepID=UPI000833BE84|nr:PH domain-containing protein [Clostridium mediterraneense]
MFNRLAADALGLSDIGKIIGPSDYNKVESDDYIFHEDNEKIFFLIKSKSDEYCFTDRALIHVDGQSAMSKKRNLKRYSYYLNNISNVSLETAGTVDLDVEIKFTIGQEMFSIDVDKNQLEQLKDLYKALTSISSIQRENRLNLEDSQKSLQLAANSIANIRPDTTQLGMEFKNINEYAFSWMVNNRELFTRKDFSEVFEKYINN